jgi:hypothetical protein
MRNGTITHFVGTGTATRMETMPMEPPEYREVFLLANSE